MKSPKKQEISKDFCDYTKVIVHRAGLRSQETKGYTWRLKHALICSSYFKMLAKLKIIVLSWD